MICGGRGRRVPCFFLWGQKIPQRSEIRPESSGISTSGVVYPFTHPVPPLYNTYKYVAQPCIIKMKGEAMATVEELVKQYETDEALQKEVAGIVAFMIPQRSPAP